MTSKRKRVYGVGTRPLNISITDEDREFLKLVGNGNASEGVRRLIKLHNDEVVK